jgi:excisionase family DNA binding protein
MERAGDLLIDSIADAVAERLARMTLCRKRLLSLEEAAEYLGMSEDAVRDLVSQSKLKPVRPTRKVQFDIRDLDVFIADLKREI